MQKGIEHSITPKPRNITADVVEGLKRDGHRNLAVLDVTRNPETPVFLPTSGVFATVDAVVAKQGRLGHTRLDQYDVVLMVDNSLFRHLEEIDREAIVQRMMELTAPGGRNVLTVSTLYPINGQTEATEFKFEKGIEDYYKERGWSVLASHHGTGDTVIMPENPFANPVWVDTAHIHVVFQKPDEALSAARRTEE